MVALRNRGARAAAGALLRALLCALLCALPACAQWDMEGRAQVVGLSDMKALKALRLLGRDMAPFVAAVEAAGASGAPRAGQPWCNLTSYGHGKSRLQLCAPTPPAQQCRPAPPSACASCNHRQRAQRPSAQHGRVPATRFVESRQWRAHALLVSCQCPARRARVASPLGSIIQETQCVCFDFLCRPPALCTRTLAHLRPCLPAMMARGRLPQSRRSHDPRQGCARGGPEAARRAERVSSPAVTRARAQVQPGGVPGSGGRRGRVALRGAVAGRRAQLWRGGRPGAPAWLPRLGCGPAGAAAAGGRAAGAPGLPAAALRAGRGGLPRRAGPGAGTARSDGTSPRGVALWLLGQPCFCASGALRIGQRPAPARPACRTAYRPITVVMGCARRGRVLQVGGRGGARPRWQTLQSAARPAAPGSA